MTIVPIEKYLANTKDRDLQEVCWLLLLELGPYSEIEILLNSIVDVSNWAVLSANKMASRQVDGVTGAIFEALETCNDENTNVIVGFLDALKNLVRLFQIVLLKSFQIRLLHGK